jgi:hypothetical protein
MAHVLNRSALQSVGQASTSGFVPFRSTRQLIRCLKKLKRVSITSHSSRVRKHDRVVAQVCSRVHACFLASTHIMSTLSSMCIYMCSIVSPLQLHMHAAHRQLQTGSLQRRHRQAQAAAAATAGTTRRTTMSSSWVLDMQAVRQHWQPLAWDARRCCSR